MGSILRLRTKGARGEGYTVSGPIRESLIKVPRYPVKTFNKGSPNRDQNKLKMWRSTCGSPSTTGPLRIKPSGLVVTTEAVFVGAEIRRVLLCCLGWPLFPGL